MRIKASLEDRYVPKFAGNQDLPPDEQIVVTLNRPTAEQREGLKGYGMEPGSGRVQITFATGKILRNHVKEITNLEDEIDGKTYVIRTGADLAESKNPKLTRLVDELKAEITRDYSLDEEEEKN